MSLKIKIEARLKAKAAGVNLSKKRIEAIVGRAEKGLTDESDDTQIDERLDDINELTPFKDMASLDDHERAKAKKIEDDRETKRLADIAAGKKPDDVELPADTPEWMKTFIAAQAVQTKALQDQIAAISTEKVANTQKDLYAAGLKGASKEYQERELKKFSKMKFDTAEEFNEFLEESKELHAHAIQEDANAGLGGERPVGGTGGGKVDNKVDPNVASFIKKATEQRAAGSSEKI